MTSNLRKLDTRHASLSKAARMAPDGSFKPLALPAVAAAVQTLAQAKPSRAAHHQEWPALLRRDAKPN